jgi:hypothetical protein
MSVFQPAFGFNGGLERSARSRFRGRRLGSLSQSFVSQLPVRLVTMNRCQREHKGRRRVPIGNTLTAEVSLDFIVPKGHSVKVVRLPAFVEGLDAGRYAVLSLRISEKRLIRPVEWSSDAAQAEFMSATKPSASDPNHSDESSTAIQPLKGRTGCPRKG